jgi:predicted dehydrogenase
MRLNTAVIGAGLFGTHWLRSLIALDNISLRAIADRNIYNAFIAARTFGADIMSSDVEAVFDDDSIDVVFITTHHNSHAPLAIRALESGKFFYLEKPHVVSFDQLDKLVQAASKSPGKLHIGFNRRYAKAIEITKALLKDKKSPLNISFISRFYETSPNSFYHWREQGTRVVSNICHHLDLAHYLIGTPPVLISGIASTIGRKDENIFISVAYEDGSLCTVLAGDRGDPTIRGEENIRITCGRLTIDITDYSKLYGREDGKVVAQWKGTKDVGSEKGLHTFFEGITQKRTVPYPHEDIYRTGFTFLKAEQALLSGNIEKME